MRRLVTLDETVPLLFRVVMVGSIYLLFAGHNQPGGGFVGGLVAAAAISLRYIAGGIDDVRSLLRAQPWTFLSLGLALAVGSALVPLLFGDAPLDQRSVEWNLAVLGKVKATSAAVFDGGVYLLVVGLVLMVFEGLGDEAEDRDAVEEAAS